MSNYLFRYKGKYRLHAPYCLNTNQFPRKLDGTLEDIDVYISCTKNIQIFYYGKSLLEVYIPSRTRGKNIVKKINEIDPNILKYVMETDGEIIFRFPAKYMGQLESVLKPKTGGAKTSPFSTKNLPKSKINIPDDKISEYKKVIKNIPQKRISSIAHSTNNFIKSLVTKNNKWEDIKADMALKGLKGNEYIYTIGKWDEYIKHLNKDIKI